MYRNCERQSVSGKVQLFVSDGDLSFFQTGLAAVDGVLSTEINSQALSLPP